MTARFMLPACTAILLLVSFASAAQTAPTNRPLVTQEELAQLEADLMARVKENQERRCLRPVLRGKPLAGAADADIVEVVEGKAFAPCFDLVGEQAEPLRAWLDLGTHEAGPPAALVDACAGLPAAVTRAARHEDSCSPYLFGRRAVPRLVTAVRGAKALAMQVRMLADAGKSAQALSLGLDSLRFYQDLARGSGAPLIAGMLATAAQEILVRDGLRPVLSGAPPSGADLQKAAGEVEALLASEPGFCDFLPYERYGMPLQLLLPGLKGKGWVPPGGFDDLGPVPEQPEGGAAPGSSKWNELAMTWLGLERVHGMLGQACLGAPGALALKGALDGLGVELASRASGSNWRRMLSVLVSPDPVLTIREWVFDILGGIAVPSFGKYVLKFMERRFQLQALRIHLEILRENGSSGKCPPMGPPVDQRFEGVFRDSASVEPMQVDVAADGTITLRPSTAFCAALGEADKPPEYTFVCR